MKVVGFPQMVDNQKQMLVWELDELVPSLALFGMGLASGLLTYMIPLIWLVNKWMKKFKLSSHRGLLQHYIYWWGLVDMHTRVKNGLTRHYGS